MLRLPGKLLAASALATLAAHVALVVPAFHRTWYRGPSAELVLVVPLVLVTLLFGRLTLSFLPPGGVGSHAWKDLPATLATSFSIGLPITSVLSSRTSWSPWSWLWILVPAAAIRWLTLPGAMVPRHPPRSPPPSRLELALAAPCAAWTVVLFLGGTPLAAAGWLGLSILVFHALADARRRRLGRLWLFGLSAALGAPPLVAGTLEHAGPALAPALALGGGAAFSIAWLRRADRRAGVLAAFFFASALVERWDPLALAGLAALVIGSRAPQRAFALRAGACSALLCALPTLVAHDAFQRGRWLRASELLARALDTRDWGLAWPLLALALVLGAASFRWRDEIWTPGTIEEPRREVRALALLLVLSSVALALPISPWSEPEALAILFPLVALLAGLLSIPGERCEPAPAGAA